MGIIATATPVVPLSESDPAGSSLAAASFPLTIGGMLGGVVISMVVTSAARRNAAVLGFGVSTSLVLTLLLQTWFQFITGDFWTTTLVMGVSITVTVAFILGYASLLGGPRLGLGVILTMFAGNPHSAARPMAVPS